MPRATSPKVALAKQWHENGGAFIVAIRTTYTKNGDAKRVMSYRQYETNDEYSPFVELTKYQARAFVAPDLRIVESELEAIREILTGSNFGRIVDLNMKRRTCQRTAQLCDAWKADKTVYLPSLMAPFAKAYA